MDSLYQNCVSEFDLEFLGPTAGASQATVAHLSLLKRRMAYIKVKCKNMSGLLCKCRKADELLRELQEKSTQDKEIIDELKEGLQTMFEERNTYSSQATEYLKVINIQKEKIKTLEEERFDVKLKDTVLKSYTEQMQGFKQETEKWTKEKEELKKKYFKEHQNFGKVVDYILYPNLPILKLSKNTKKWALPILKDLRAEKFKHGFLEHNSRKTSVNMSTSPIHVQEEESLKIQKVPVDTEITNDSKLDEVILDDVELQANSSTLNRNISLDFDYIGSVDTGRGSSLAFSDGEKSFHSPDYYMTDSPLCTGPIVCSKCNILKSNVSTSPIPQETFDIAISSLTIACKEDACTSPILDQNEKSIKRCDDDISMSQSFKIKCTTRENPDDVTSPDKQDSLTLKVLDKLNINTGKRGVATSPMASSLHGTGTAVLSNIKYVHNETLDLVITSPEKQHTETTNTCKSDACTSPLALQRFDVATETSTIITSLGKQYNTVNNEIDHSNFKQTTNICNKEDCTSPMASQRFDVSMEVSDAVTSPEKQYNAVSKVTVHSNFNESTNIVDAAQTSDFSPEKQDKSKVLQGRSNSILTIPASIDHGPVNILSANGNNHGDTAPDKITSNTYYQVKNNLSKPDTPNDTDEDTKTNQITIIFDEISKTDVDLINNTSRLASPVEEDFITVLSDYHDKSATSNNNISGKHVPIKLQNGTPDTELKVGRNKIKEKECLELNNCNNFSTEVATDNEIQRYLNKMKLRYRLLTPIPPSPPREATPSPGLRFNDKNTSLSKPYDENVNIVLSPKEMDIYDHIPKHTSKISFELAVIQYIHYLMPKKGDTLHENEQELFSYNAATPTKSLPVDDPFTAQNVDTVFNKICGDLNEHIVKYLSSDTMEAITHLLSNKGPTSHENTHKIYSSNEGIESNKNISDVVNSDSGLTLSIKKTTDNIVIENEYMALYDDADIQQDLESEYLEQISGKENDNNEKLEEIYQTPNDLPKSISKNKIIIIHNDQDGKADCLNNKPVNNKSSTKSNCVHISQKNTLESFSNNDKNSESINMQRNYGMQELLLFEDLELLTSKENNTTETEEMGKEHSPNEKLLNKTGKRKKLSKLEKMRIKMVPKNKIKNEKPAKKMLFKPTPIVTPVKKKVTESDSAASLNDKCVYENAVKVITASKSKCLLTKEPRILLEDCVLGMRNSPQKSASNNGINEKTFNNTSKFYPPPDTANAAADIIKSKKRNLSYDFENVMNVPENLRETRKSPQGKVCENPVACKKICVSQSPEARRETVRTSDSNGSVLNSEKNTLKRNRSVSDRKSLEENVTDEPAILQKTGQEPKYNIATVSKIVESSLHSSHSFDKTDLTSAKRDSELNESMLFSERYNAKRRRISHLSSQNLFGYSSSNAKSAEMTDNNNHVKTNQKVGDCETIKINRRRISSFKTRHIDNEVDNTLALDHNVSNKATNNLSTAIRRDSNYKLSSTAHELLFTDIKNNNSPSKANRLTSCDVRSDNNARCKTNAVEVSNVSPKRVLRSTNDKHKKMNGIEIDGIIPLTTKYNLEEFRSNVNKNQNQSKQNVNRAVLTSPESNHRKTNNRIEVISTPVSEFVSQNNHDAAVSYADLSLFLNEEDCDQEQNKQRDEPVNECGKNILCRMIEKYGIESIKYFAKKVPETKINEICNKLETSISHIIELPHEQCLDAMKRLVIDIRSWNAKHFLHGLMKFLKDPQRKFELFSKLYAPPAPSMTKTEQILLYVIDELQKDYNYRNIVRKILTNIEFVLFALNKSPEFEVVETMSHFYSLICRHYQQLSKLRAFLVDALYCLQYKSINLVTHCLDVWMLTLPLGHLGLAKTPLVVCLVYLLHFYKCENKFDRIQELRNTLRRKFNYDLTDWNETKILDLFWTTIKEVREDRSEKQTLRLALIVLAKRNGAKWCQKNIIKNMLQPLIADQSTADVAKRFCVSLLGPLVKPYPNDMKVHSEMIIDYLLDMLEQKHSPKMQEAIISSLICMNKNNNRVIQFLVKWDPKQVSPEFELMFKDFIRSKTVRKWKTILSQLDC